ncbi:hypothetical protein GNP84_19730 [Aliivibrio fischeri]|uniref:hypothetical protein n=1 Tax=Aliivibrio fischeri TaxID=668 RepID=UPI0012D8DBDB|nr:hypothetical protein [Aliivibrio fischeri]MUK79108.1 hypothetical protein [Aliivibrio fischeri]
MSTKKIEKLVKNFMPLEDGETIVEAIRGDAYNTSSNIVARLVGLAAGIIAKVTGSKSTVTLVVTEKRIIHITSTKMFWFFDGSITASTFAPRSVNSTGYALRRSMIFFKSHYLDLLTSADGVMIRSTDGKDKVYRMIEALTNLQDRVKTS